MHQVYSRTLGQLIVAGLWLFSFTASALTIEPGIGAGIQYTDNAALATDNEEDDWIVVGYVGANLQQTSGPVTGSASTSLTHQNYTNSTFGNQNFFNLNATAGWEMIRNQVNWLAVNKFSQRKEESIDPETPDNSQDTNVFSVGPNITLPISGLQTLTVNPLYSNFWYEDSDTDNQQYSLALNWTYQFKPQLSAGLSGSVRKTDYDDEDLNPNFVTTGIHGVLSGQRARSSYNVTLGATFVNRDRVENQNGMSGDLNWQIDLTGSSSARVYLGSDLTDTSASALNSQIDPGRGDSDNEQISGDVIRNNVMRTEYQRRDSTLNTSAWIELRDIEYKETPDDREVQSGGITLAYNVTALFSSGVYGRYTRTKETDNDRTDKEYVVGGDIGYRLSRKLRSVFDLRYRTKDSTDDVDEYDEISGFFSLVYGYGNVSRAK